MDMTPTRQFTFPQIKEICEFLRNPGSYRDEINLEVIFGLISKPLLDPYVQRVIAQYCSKDKKNISFNGLRIWLLLTGRDELETFLFSEDELMTRTGLIKQSKKLGNKYDYSLPVSFFSTSKLIASATSSILGTSSDNEEFSYFNQPDRQSNEQKSNEQTLKQKTQPKDIRLSIDNVSVHICIDR
jgi:hypothetical protein